MNNLKNIVSKYNLNPLKYGYKKSARIIETEDGKYVLKKKKEKNKNDIYDYLHARNFTYYLPIEKEDDNYEIYRYVDEKNISKEDKALDLIYALSMLHIKTTTYKEVLLDDVKRIYEEVLEKIKYLNEYYHNMQDYIESKIYFAPEEYLLIRHMTDIYQALNFSHQNIEKWYEVKTQEKKERVVQLHNNISLDHFLEEDNPYFISWDKSKKDIVIYDFLKFYHNEYLNLEMNSLFDVYQSKYKYTEEEKLLFFALISLPEKIELKQNHYINTQIVSKLVKYVIKTRGFILKENEKNQKVDKNEFEE